MGGQRGKREEEARVKSSQHHARATFVPGAESARLQMKILLETIRRYAEMNIMYIEPTIRDNTKLHTIASPRVLFWHFWLLKVPVGIIYYA
jgi:hypothetical protein